jgi:hypothetical protein
MTTGSWPLRISVLCHTVTTILIIMNTITCNSFSVLDLVFTVVSISWRVEHFGCSSIGSPSCPFD